MSKNKKDIQTIVRKEMPEFVEEVNTASVEELEARLAQLSKDREATQDSKDADEDLEEAQAHARELGAPYRDALKYIRLRSRFIIAILKERGGK